MQKTKIHFFEHSDNLKPYIIIGVGVLVVAVSVYQLLVGAPGNLFQSRSDTKASLEAANPGSTQEKDQESLVVENIDSDSDGLTDTEEDRIYHTDPLKPDTDKDGYKDGDEIKTGHDPLVNEGNSQGSDGSALADDPTSQQYNRFIASSPDDLSKIDPKQYLDKGALDSLNSGDSSDQSIEKLATLALSNTTISTAQVLPNIPDSELTIIDSTGKQAVQQYLISLASILIPLMPVANQKQMESYITDAANGDLEKATKLLSISKTAEKQIMMLPVPRELVDTHKKIIGTIRTFEQSATALLNSDNIDATAGMNAVNQLRIIGNATTDLYTTLKGILTKYNITSLVP